MPCRAGTRFSTACSLVDIDRGRNAAIVPQVGQIHSDAVGQFHTGANRIPFSYLQLGPLGS
jgi:hypothetical protein